MINTARPGRITPINLRATRAFLITGDAHVLVDTGSPGDARRILRELGRRGLDPRDLSLIVITHAHYDHVGSLRELAAASGAPVAASREEAPYVTAGTTPPASAEGRLGSQLLRLVPLRDRMAGQGYEPDILIDDRFDLAPYGVTGDVVPTPGHTMGSLSVVLDAGQAIIGDLLMGRFSLAGPPAAAFFAADKEATRASVASLLEADVHTFYTTHGGPYSAIQVRDWLNRSRRKT